MERLLERLDLSKNSLTYIDNKFIMKKEIIGNLEEIERSFITLIKNLNKELSNLWGEKFIFQKYSQAYKKFVEEHKNDLFILDLIEKLSPENIEF